MDPGQRNCRIVIKQQASGQDAEGEASGAWVPVVTVYAKILAQNGIETVRAGAPASLVQVSMRIRRRTDLDAGMRVTYAGVDYEIVSVAPPGSDRQYMDLVCQVVS